MPRSSPALAFLLSVAGLAGFSTAAMAGGTAGRVSQVSPVVTGVGSGFGTTQGLNVLVQPSVGLETAGNVAPITTSANTLNVQTNIDNTKTIDSSSDITVTDTVNGSNVAYGGNGANLPQTNVLGVIDSVANFNASISANNGLNVTAVTDALDTASFLSAQGN
jgi:hypothetical protein